MGRKLVNFDLTREDIPPLEGHDWYRETPFTASMATEDLRVENTDHRRFQAVLTLACQMMERANPGMLAAMIDPATDPDGHVIGMTVTVIPE
jgi:hypothetical protein